MKRKLNWDHKDCRHSIERMWLHGISCNDVIDTIRKSTATIRLISGRTESLYSYFNFVYAGCIYKNENPHKVYLVTDKGSETKEAIKPYRCTCGGMFQKSRTQVEFFGIDFGARQGEICSKCNAEYLSDETMEQIEKQVKYRRIFGMERAAAIEKMASTFSVRIPQKLSSFVISIKIIR